MVDRDGVWNTAKASVFWATHKTNRASAARTTARNSQSSRTGFKVVPIDGEGRSITGSEAQGLPKHTNDNTSDVGRQDEAGGMTSLVDMDN